METEKKIDGMFKTTFIYWCSKDKIVPVPNSLELGQVWFFCFKLVQLEKRMETPYF